jgi:hypothetical protein
LFVNSMQTGRVSIGTSLFNYALTNSTYAQTNHLEYIPYSSPPRQTSPSCSYLQGALPASCKSLNASFFYQTCLSDVSATNLDSLGLSSVIAFSELCVQINSTLGISLL